MAHKEQQDFCLGIKEIYPVYFTGKKVLDVGSLDINGNNRFLFTNCDITGIDVGEGKNVDVVSLAHEFNAPDETYDVIISTECFEHDMFYEQSLRNIVRMLKPGGLFLFTCASVNRPEHGTSRTTPQDSPLTGWDYYKNLDDSDIRSAIQLDDVFSNYRIYKNNSKTDLYFFGIKKGGNI